ncbi:helix-turn-helix domain-containing protein [Aquimarina sp. RZ0]|uniref:helix-turn-helix domain-containing protein n=1 Tax=Aquimarina sp. RZ0 TaxID=2607730 RepID=UPI0011F388B3|nr:helix-turn-helix domain-containing protein [Aquimarina sp. RZ0]KAA1245787.1 helix-turn-helix domain-containing protein [Aquimarina sp. RZ0]
MAATIITTEDLYEFKLELLEEIKILLQDKPSIRSKKYLKSAEVMELLKISPGTLQNLRINGTLPYSKVGGIIIYDQDEITKVIEENRIHHTF